FRCGAAPPRSTSRRAARSRHQDCITHSCRKKVVTVAIPIELSGIPGGVQARCEQLGLEIASPRGDLYRATASPYARPQGNSFQSSIFPPDRNPVWQIFRLDRSLYDRIKDERVKVAGKAGAAFYRAGEPLWLPVGSGAA